VLPTIGPGYDLAADVIVNTSWAICFDALAVVPSSQL
jgi:hypothetical protein